LQSVKESASIRTCWNYINHGFAKKTTQSKNIETQAA